MALRAAHGKAKQRGRVVVVETTAADELPSGVPAVPLLPLPDVERTASGCYANRDAAAEAGRRGGRAAAAARVRRAAALEGLGLRGVLPPNLAVFERDAEQWLQLEAARLARDVGGGNLTPNVAVLLQSAAHAMMLGRAATSEGNAAVAVRCSAEVRANLLAAHELAAREAKARGPRVDPALAKLFEE